MPATLDSLTALRFLAALMVVLFHFSDRAVAESWLRSEFFRHGYLGVDLFFVLSGFILSHVYLAAAEAGRFRFGRFLFNRLARIYPLHVFMLVLTALWALAASFTGRVPVAVYGPQMGLDPDGGGTIIGNALSHLLLLHATGLDARLYFNGPSWSIGAEWLAYLLFPLFAAAASGLSRRPVAAFVAAAFGLVIAETVSLALFGNSLTERTYDVALLRIAPEFLLGCLAYAVMRHHAVPCGLIWPGVAATLVAIAALLAGLLPTIAAPALFAALIVLVAEGERQRIPGLAKPNHRLVYLGEISYSTYMVHLLAGKVFFMAIGRLDGLDPHALPAPAILAGVLFVHAVSVLSYQLVEQPSRRWLRRLYDGVAVAAAAR